MLPNSIKKLVADYEANLQTGVSFFMEAEDLLQVLDYYLEREEDVQAERCLEIALRLHPDNDHVQLAHAYRLKDLGHWSEAHAIVRSISDQSLPDIKLFYIETDIAALRLDKAHKRFITALHEINPTPDPLFCLDYAELLLDYGFARRCLDTLEFLLPNADDKKRLWELAGEAHMLLEEYEQAEEYYQQQVEADRFDDISWEQLAEVQMRAGEYEKAVESLDYALAVNPQSQKAVDMKLNCATHLDDLDLIESVGQEYLQIAPESPLPYLALATSHYATGNYDKAINLLHEAASYCPPNSSDRARVSGAMAMALLKSRRYTEAMEYLQATTPCGIDTWDTIFNALREAIDLKQYAEAEAYFDAYTEQFRIRGEHLCNTATYLYQQELFRPVRKIWEYIAHFSEALPREVQDMINHARQEISRHR